MSRLPFFPAALIWLTWSVAAASAVEVAPLLQSLREVDKQGQGHRAATAAVQQLQQADARQLPEILAGMKGANPLAENWIRAAAETIADRQLRAGGKLPVAELEAFVRDTQHAPRARRLAYELVAKVDPQAEARLVSGFVEDPSLELRRDAIAALLEKAEQIPAGEKPAVIAAYRRILDAARDLDQIALVKKKLTELGEKVDLPRQFGFIVSWKLIGPFDNSNKGGFDVPYPPEKEIDFAATYPGKDGKEVRWQEHTSTDASGMGNVDLNTAIGKHMGAVAYAAAEFVTDRAQPVELRLGCINANKVWLNGELLTANHVYHTGQQVDQYVGKGTLRPGKNTILVKIAQNEQTDDWAQNWKFQLRVCDAIGTAVLSQDRPADTSTAPAASAGNPSASASGQ